MKIIAELGSNPAPQWDFHAWCGLAQRAGADAVKVQLWWPEHFGADEARIKRPCVFPRARLGEFAAAAHECGLEAGASVFDFDAMQLGARHLDWLKLAAREQENEELVQMVLRAGRPVYQSVSNLGYERALRDDNYVCLFTVSKYPAGLTESVIGLMRASNAWRGMRWGWSSHTRTGIECLQAARLGACVIERHLCRHPADVEAGHSSRPDEFKRLTLVMRRLSNESASATRP